MFMQWKVKLLQDYKQHKLNLQQLEKLEILKLKLMFKKKTPP